MTAIRRKTSRIYHVSEGKYLHISKEWSMKFGQNLYYVYTWGEIPELTLLKVPTFAEAMAFVRNYGK